MKFHKGDPRCGRRKGAKNKNAKQLQDMIMRCFHELQVDGAPYSLIEWAKANPKEFYCGLLPRLLPKPVELQGGDGFQFVLQYLVGDQVLELEPTSEPKLLESEPVLEAEYEPLGEDG
jgi:hypothetical protein